MTPDLAVQCDECVRLRALLHESVAQELPRLEEVQLHWRIAELERWKAAALTLTTEASVRRVMEKE